MKAKSTNYYLIKAEPESRIENGVDVKFSIDDLEISQKTAWEGVRNYEARNNMKKMKVDDLCFFYHSSCKVPGIAGLARVVKEAYVDHTAFDKSHPYYDPKSDKLDPKWYMVDVQFEKKLKFISLKELQKFKDKELRDFALLKRSRLSVISVDKPSFDFIMNIIDTPEELE
ncbi:Thymocyte nuclear protein 1 [Terramyces sp. JEL0728]|nr:Thymocyte nuclear protein 1 [Terramyces sp. JEL0728]